MIPCFLLPYVSFGYLLEFWYYAHRHSEILLARTYERRSDNLLIYCFARFDSCLFIFFLISDAYYLAVSISTCYVISI
ncbi:hypothetical protein PILCRDRAFT_630754 [Piloderma croceum F 1598]|uniref:Uncharacterized protein n=1 Tax=Piloderma croceum (strain F 1598) TaxID=765440 RepID=A0A0C3EWY3_PILCF|nr:hypothetical protein PILCRDRAFT_630754 [Piloderma croceum F 1598]